MRESTAYQAILAESRAEGLLMGESKGRAEEARQLLLRIGRKKLGPPEPAVEEAVQAITDLQHLEVLIERLLDAASWQDLLRTP